jgi:hypothetical protein
MTNGASKTPTDDDDEGPRAGKTQEKENAARDTSCVRLEPQVRFPFLSYFYTLN